MYCLHPIEVRKYRKILDHVQEDESDLTKYKSVKTNSYQLVPCGKCVACLSRKRNEWTYRLTKEKEYSDYTYFATLTYDQQNIPIKIQDGIPYFVFNKKHVQDYMKRIRYFISKVSDQIQIGYYLVSEYGGIGHRPHYHMILYVKNDGFLQHKKQIDMILRNTWPYGFVTFKAATPANIHYVTKYCVKNLETFPEDCIDPVFILVSKRPYIGASHEMDLQQQVDLSFEAKVFNNGFPGAMPRIYRQKTGVSGLSVRMSDLDPRLTVSQELQYITDYRKSHSSFSVNDFHDYVQKRLFAIEKAAERRQLQRNEKL